MPHFPEGEADLVLADYIHQLVSSAKEVSESIGGILGDDLEKRFEVSYSSLAVTKGLLEASAETITRLFDENQRMFDILQKLKNRVDERKRNDGQA